MGDVGDVHLKNHRIPVPKTEDNPFILYKCISFILDSHAESNGLNSILHHSS